MFWSLTKHNVRDRESCSSWVSAQLSSSGVCLFSRGVNCWVGILLRMIHVLYLSEVFLFFPGFLSLPECLFVKKSTRDTWWTTCTRISLLVGRIRSVTYRCSLLCFTANKYRASYYLYSLWNMLFSRCFFLFCFFTVFLLGDCFFCLPLVTFPLFYRAKPQR